MGPFLCACCSFRKVEVAESVLKWQGKKIEKNNQSKWEEET